MEKGTKPNTKIQDQYLRGINYPVNKSDLITRVRSNGAPDDLVQRVQRLSQDKFQSQQELTQAFERI